MDIDNLYISNVHARRGGKTDTMSLAKFNSR
jgi:hypothetical protein